MSACPNCGECLSPKDDTTPFDRCASCGWYDGFEIDRMMEDDDRETIAPGDERYYAPKGCPACGIIGCDLNCPQGGD